MYNDSRSTYRHQHLRRMVGQTHNNHAGKDQWVVFLVQGPPIISWCFLQSEQYLKSRLLQANPLPQNTFNHELPVYIYICFMLMFLQIYPDRHFYSAAGLNLWFLISKHIRKARFGTPKVLMKVLPCTFICKQWKHKSINLPRWLHRVAIKFLSPNSDNIPQFSGMWNSKKNTVNQNELMVDTQSILKLR